MTDDEIIDLAAKHGLGEVLRPICQPNPNAFATAKGYRTGELLEFSRALRAEALEEAARQCEEVKAEAERWARGADTGMYDHQAQGAENCADAIRSFSAATKA